MAGSLPPETHQEPAARSAAGIYTAPGRSGFRISYTNAALVVLFLNSLLLSLLRV